MKVLVLGNGGREHALASTFAKSLHEVFLFPGNAGAFEDKKIKKVELSQIDKELITEFSQKERIDLIVVGPENLLAEGYVDYFSSKNLIAYGPSQSAAKLESSKIFSKEFMKEFKIPTADFFIAEDYDEAVSFLESNKFNINEGIVLKADGLAAGKGVVVTFDRDEAIKTAFDFMKNEKISVKSDRLLIEKCLKGKEISVFAICDGDKYFLLGSACDYKRVFDGNDGPNTGGMGCYTPRCWPSNEVIEKVKKEIIEPTIQGMKNKGTPFKGTLFCGLMVDQQNVNVIEYNVRFGDPETQTLLPLIDGDLAKLLFDAAKGRIETEVNLKKLYSVHLVKTSKGYPSIDGTPMILNQRLVGDFENAEDSEIFYAGVKKIENDIVNAGGRVFGITCLAESLSEARENAYRAIKKISFEGEHYRKDIALDENEN